MKRSRNNVYSFLVSSMKGNEEAVVLYGVGVELWYVYVLYVLWADGGMQYVAR